MYQLLMQGNSTVDNATTAVAASAVASPIWLPWLAPASEAAAAVMPLLGAVWLVVQIIAKVREIRGKDK